MLIADFTQILPFTQNTNNQLVTKLKIKYIAIVFHQVP